MPQRPCDPAGGVLGVPRLEPGPGARLKLLDDAGSDRGVDVGPRVLVVVAVHASPPSGDEKNPVQQKHMLLGNGDEGPKARGRAVKDDRRRRAPVCTKRSAEDWEEAAGGRVAPILDGSGDVPPRPGSCEKPLFSHRRCPPEAATQPTHQEAEREPARRANATAANAEPGSIRSPPGEVPDRTETRQRDDSSMGERNQRLQSNVFHTTH